MIDKPEDTSRIQEPMLGEKGRGFVEKLKDWRLKAFFFDDDGRIGRRAFWYYFFGVMALSFVIFFSKTLRPQPFVHLAFGLVLLFPSYCVFSKRLQDIGISGSWAVLIILVSAIDAVLAFSGLKANPRSFVAAINLWSMAGIANAGVFFILLGCWPGTNGANRYGLRWPPW